MYIRYKRPPIYLRGEIKKVEHVSKTDQSAELAEDVEKFLEAGGTIKEVPSGVGAGSNAASNKIINCDPPSVSTVGDNYEE